MKLSADVFHALDDVRSARMPAVLATVVSSVGSAPQDAGAKLLLSGDGQVAGTVGGGAFEQRVLEEAHALLAGTGERTLLLELNLSRDLGMCCGGVMTVFFEVVAFPARLVVLGAGHIARPLVALASQVGFEVTVVDERGEWATAERFPEARRVLCDEPEAVVAELALDSETAVVVVTHHHPLDQALVRALVHSRAGFCGLVGSEAKRNKFIMRLTAQGVPAVALARLRSPVGVQIGAVTPEEIALSIVAELVAWRRGVALDDGVPLRAKRQRAADARDAAKTEPA
jgi:xanthine dehydrogenase accessory factor